MAFCNQIGIGHKEWLETWDEEDRAKALAFEMEKSLKCGMCGTAEWEWEQDKYAYYPQERICPGCEKKDFVMQTRDKGHPGLYVALVPKDLK